MYLFICLLDLGLDFVMLGSLLLLGMAKTIGGGIGSIGDDLVEEILVRLPAKSLTRFRSVCKEWLSLISSDQFCHRHTLRRPKLRPSLILMTNTLQFFHWDPTINGEKAITPYRLSAPYHRIINSCGGLLLLYSYLQDSCCVYNPTTRRSRMISLSDSAKHTYSLDLQLAFDPSKSPYYKIVRFSTSLNPDTSHVYEEEQTFQVEVYDSESHTWKLSLEPLKYDAPHNGGAHWNNAIYWATCYFDITKNEIKPLLSPGAPESEHQGGTSTYIQESNGRLYKYVKGRFHESVAVWELGGEDHSQWLFKYHLPLHSTAGNYSTYILGVMWGSEGDDTCSLLTFSAGKIGAYSFVDKSYKDLVDITSHTFYQQVDKKFSIQAYVFGECLALV